MNDKFGLSQKSFQSILLTLDAFPEIEEAKIFGSRALGNFRKGSDVDIAIYGQNLRIDTALNLSAILNERLNIPYNIDVVAPEFLTNQNLYEHIKRVGQPFYPQK